MSGDVATIWKFDRPPAIDSAFAATLIAEGGETLILTDTTGQDLLTIVVEADRTLHVRPTGRSAWGESVRIASLPVARGISVGFQLSFGAGTVLLTVADEPCFSDRLPGGLDRIGAITGAGRWDYPCVWRLTESLPVPLETTNLAEAAPKPLDRRPYVLVVGGASPGLFDRDCRLHLVVEPDPITSHRLEADLRRLNLPGHRIYLRAALIGGPEETGLSEVRLNVTEDRGRRIARTAPPDESGGIAVSVPTLTLPAVFARFGPPRAIVAPDSDRFARVCAVLPAISGDLVALTGPLGETAVARMDALGFNAFRLHHRRTLEAFGAAAIASRTAAPQHLSRDGLAVVMSERNAGQHPFYVIVGRRLSDAW